MTVETKPISDEQYAAVHASHVSHDSLMWQVPALGMAAQAFLFSTIFAESTPLVGRIITSFLALAAAVASLHLFAKHRAMALRDADLLRAHELAKGWPVVHERVKYTSKNRLWAWFINLRAYDVWLSTSFVFVGAAAIALAIQLFALFPSRS